MTYHITRNGRIRGLWSDEARLTELGNVHVRRASHVEFDAALQRWTVTDTAGILLHHARTRADALAWEHDHFQPGGPGWPSLSAVPTPA